MIFNHAILNGKLIPLEQAQILLFNESLFHSFGIYETVKIDQGQPFYLEEHLRRLFKSAAMLNLELEVSFETLQSWFEKLKSVDPQATWRLKIIVIGASQPNTSPIIGMQPTKVDIYPRSLYKEGGSAILYEGQRVIPACKSLNTLVNYLARREARQKGAIEGLLHHNGYLTEGSRSNLFVVQEGQIITPPEESVLSGITREVVIRAMEETDHPVAEASVSVYTSLYEEIFVTSTSMHVMPITHIDGIPVGEGQIGPITKIVIEQFEEYYHQTLNLD